MVGMLRLGGERAGLVTVADGTGTAGGGGEREGLEVAVPPGQVDGEAAAGAQASYLAVGEGGGEGREEIDAVVLALEQHLGDAGCAAKVAIDLERRMRVEHIRVYSAVFTRGADGIGEQFIEQFQGVVAVAEAGPAVDLPGDR